MLPLSLRHTPFAVDRGVGPRNQRCRLVLNAVIRLDGLQLPWRCARTRRRVARSAGSATPLPSKLLPPLSLQDQRHTPTVASPSGPLPPEAPPLLRSRPGSSAKSKRGRLMHRPECEEQKRPLRRACLRQRRHDGQRFAGHGSYAYGSMPSSLILRTSFFVSGEARGLAAHLGREDSAALPWPDVVSKVESSW